MSEIKLTAEQKMQLAIDKKKEERKKAKDEAILALINNEKYVDYLAAVEDESEQVKSLTAIMDLLNKMKAIITNDGTKYTVNIYPVAEYVFGPVMSRVIGIITGSSSMFTDERQTEFEVITGLNYLTMLKAREALGSPAYCKKDGTYVTSIEGNGDCIKQALTAVCAGLDIDIEYVKKVNKTNLDKWFEISEIKANKQKLELIKAEKLDDSNEFILED